MSWSCTHAHAGPMKEDLEDDPSLDDVPGPVGLGPWWRPLVDAFADVGKRAVLWVAFQRARQPERIKEGERGWARRTQVRKRKFTPERGHTGAQLAEPTASSPPIMGHLPPGKFNRKTPSFQSSPLKHHRALHWPDLNLFLGPAPPCMPPPLRQSWPWFIPTRALWMRTWWSQSGAAARGLQIV